MPRTGNPTFQNITSSQRSRLLANLSAAETARKRAVTGATHEEQARAWKRWCEFADESGFGHNILLDGLTKPNRAELLGGFAEALRSGKFSGPSIETLAEVTIRNAISYVAATFRDKGRPNPTLDEDGELARILSRQFRAYRNTDPPVKQQKAIPACILLEMMKCDATERQKAIAQLAVGGFFFACRSCEYLKVPQSEKRRTDILRLRCIRFFKDGKELPHDHPDLERAGVVSVTFEKQKKDEKMDTVNLLASGELILCPVRTWAKIVKRIRGYPNSSDNTPVSAVWENGRVAHVTSNMMINALEDAADAVGRDKLNIKRGEIGTHSIRSGAAMAMFLGEVSVERIKMIGRWNSTVFLRYIRKQVEQFSQNVSKMMIRHQFHRHIPQVQRAIDRQEPQEDDQPSIHRTRGVVGGDAARRMLRSSSHPLR